MSSSSKDLCEKVIFRRRKKIKVNQSDSSSLVEEMVLSESTRRGLVEGEGRVGCYGHLNHAIKEGGYRLNSAPLA